MPAVWARRAKASALRHMPRCHTASCLLSAPSQRTGTEEQGGNAARQWKRNGGVALRQHAKTAEHPYQRVLSPSLRETGAIVARLARRQPRSLTERLQSRYAEQTPSVLRQCEQWTKN